MISVYRIGADVAVAQNLAVYNVLFGMLRMVDEVCGFVHQSAGLQYKVMSLCPRCQ